MQERGYSAHGAYSLSKLANILFTYGLADRLRAAGSPLTTNCLDPGKPSQAGKVLAWREGARMQGRRRAWRRACAPSPGPRPAGSSSEVCSGPCWRPPQVCSNPC